MKELSNVKYENLRYLAVDLPEDIMKEKWSGNFERARMLIECRKTEEIPHALRCRLDLELKNLQNLERCYTVTRTEALRQVRERIPEMEEAEFDQLQLEGKLDWIYLNGQVRYLSSFCATLFKVNPQLWQRTVQGDQSDYQVLDDLLSDLEDGQETCCHIHIRQEVSLKDQAVEEGRTLHVHIPVPLERNQVNNLQLLAINPAPVHMAEDGDSQPTLYFEESAALGQVFSVEYAFDHRTSYIDLTKAERQQAAAAALPQGTEAYLYEELPHVQFTPYLRSLAAEIRGEETNLLFIARRIYDFITTKVRYAFMRDYACIDNLAQYCALNLKGDCGVQALLFITLCRICGIPAKWQSGIDAKPGDVGEHDWAMFYVPGTGWAYADLSYGGAAYLRGAYDRWNYFFGNADPYRIPINDGFQKEFHPPKKFYRIDPYDNQSGEAEYDDHGVKGDDLIYHYQEIDIHRIR